MKTRELGIEKERKTRDTRRLSNLLTSNELLPFSSNFNPSNWRTIFVPNSNIINGNSIKIEIGIERWGRLLKFTRFVNLVRSSRANNNGWILLRDSNRVYIRFIMADKLSLMRQASERKKKYRNTKITPSILSINDPAIILLSFMHRIRFELEFL